jgi:hypothetical protein
MNIAARTLKHAQILLAADAGASDEEITRKARGRRLDRLSDQAPCEATCGTQRRATELARKLSGKAEALRVATACSTPSEGRAAAHR